MKKATRTLVAAVTVFALSGGAFAQSSGGAGGAGTGGSTASPANQVNSGTNTSGYGTPGMPNSDSGMSAPNSGLPSGVNNAPQPPAPKTNNTLATPSVVSPAAQ